MSQMSQKSWNNAHAQVKQTKLSQKVLYHFAIFAIVNKLLIIKNRHINPVYRLIQMRRDASIVPIILGHPCIHTKYFYMQNN